MVIHLVKQTDSISKEGISIKRMACVNDPFVRGYIVTLDEFNSAMQAGKTCCKKCQKISLRYKS
jgi:hypothetical protein